MAQEEEEEEEEEEQPQEGETNIGGSGEPNKQDNSNNNNNTNLLLTTLPEAVIFDFDGTILDTEWVEYESYKELYRREGGGVDLSIEIWSQCVGSDYNHWSPETYLEKLTGKSFDWHELHKPRNAWVKSQLETHDARNGIREAIDYFTTRNIPLAIASSSERSWVEPWLEKLDLRKYFEAVICREDVTACKPSPELFEKAVAGVGKAPQNCWVIEDSLNGLKGGIAAGCKVIITHHPITAHYDFSGAILVADSMEKVLQQIKKAAAAAAAQTNSKQLEQD